MIVMNREIVITALENCVAIPKCRDCPWKPCEYEHEIRGVPLSLLKATLELLKLNGRLEDDLK